MAKKEISILPRKLPAQSRSRQTYALLLEAAAQILVAHGEQSVTTNAIAERAGFSIGTLYQYFPDRDAILIALAERERERISKNVRDFFGQVAEGAPPDAMRGMVRMLIRSFARRRGARRQYALLALRMATRDDGGNPYSEFTDILVGAWRRSGLDHDDAMERAAAFVLTRAVQGVLRAAVLERSTPIKEQAFEDALLLLITSFETALRAGRAGAAISA